MDGEMKVFRRYNIVDFASLVLVLLAISGFLLANAQKAGVNQVIRGTHPIDITVYFTGVKTKDPDLFKVGETTSLTIRNQPVQPPFKIKEATTLPKQVAFLSPDGKKAISFPDPSMPIYHDFEVTITDTAEVTDDGFIVRGQKLKVGNKVDLESFKYRVEGVVVDIKAVDK